MCEPNSTCSQDHLLGTSLHAVTTSVSVPSTHSSSFTCRKGVNMNASPFHLLTFPSFLFSRLRAVSGLSELLPGLVWDHKCITGAGFSCPPQGPEFQPNEPEHFCKCRKQIQSLCGPGTGSKFQYFYWLQFHPEKEGPLATGQQGLY